MRALGASRTSVATGGILGANWARDPLWKNARAVPSLDLRFAENKSLTDAKTGASLVTFTRASSSTYVGSDGLIKTATTNEARFDHNPITGESLGLLVEEARTNLLVRSEEFDNASWVKLNTTASANAVVSPTGDINADLVIDTSTPAEHYFSQDCSTTTNQAYTQVIFAKAGTAPSFRIMVVAIGSSSITSQIIFTQTAGVFVASAITGLITSATVVAVNNGWYRCAVTYTLNGTVTTHQMRIYPYLSGIYAGTGLGTYFWGAQLEAGAFATSYIPTTTATTTRAADVASITGSNFSSWYNQTEGTVFAETQQIGSILGYPMALSDGTDNNRIAQFRSATTLGNRITRSGISTNPSNITIADLVSLRSVIAARAGNATAAANGTLGVTEATPTVLPTVDRFFIGLGALGTLPINGTIKRVTYWPVRLANPTLVSITQP
jgi:hypothetical protein